MEVGECWHDDMIAARLIIGLRTVMTERDWHPAKERIKLGVPVVGLVAVMIGSGMGYFVSMPSICSELKTV
ncbi:hypothetical protein [Novosphingobium resinovorum]|uniref:hypothetical protein n=1 Tax=Novosphingobium resinovorum TaxID=158500 RepID=UPI003D2996F7